MWNCTKNDLTAFIEIDCEGPAFQTILARVLPPSQVKGLVVAFNSWFPQILTALTVLGLAGISTSNAETRTLTNAWSFLIRYACDSSPAVAEDGTIYFGVWNGDFRAFRPDGFPKWVFHAGREIKSSPALASDGTIYFGSRDRKLYALTLDGTKKWEFKTGGWVDSSPTVAKDGTIYFGS
jgi:outer membrane protein assembly factor BamB